MMKGFSMMMALGLLVGCSSISKVFRSESKEDYNKLTYGDESSSWTSSRTTSEVAERGMNSRTPSSTQDVEGDQYVLDPTDENTRERIENSRNPDSSTSFYGTRAIKEDFQDRTPGDGSLWSGENDSNYFYTKTKVRARGDIVTVKLENDLIRNVAEEIKKTLTPAEQEVEMAIYSKNSPAAREDKDLQAYRNISSDDLKSEEAEGVKSKMEKAVRWSQIDLSPVIGMNPNEDIRAEIIDRFQNGNYKIRAVKRVMFRGSSKLVSMVAVAPSSDFEEGDLIKSGKLYEYKIRVAR